MNHQESKPIKQRRPKQKIEKSNEEFKEHERIIMDKRIAEVNNVITKKCHTLWNQYLYLKKKPHTLQFNFVYHGLENYLKKCDDYKAEQHKDNKQKWWNNQKASEMSQQFLPSVLNSTDHMAQYIGKQIEVNLQMEFNNYVTFELLETAITSVFSTQRSGSNEVFLRTSFQYAKAGLRKKLVSYFGDGELREYDTKARKKKDLWQRLIKDKKEKLLQMFLQKKNIYSQDSKVGIISDIMVSDNICNTNNNNNNNNTLSMNTMNLYHDNKQATFGYDVDTTNDENTMYINPPPSLLNAAENNNNNNNYYDGYCTYNNNNNNNNNNHNLMDGLNGSLPFPQPLLMDITLTYPNNHASNDLNLNNNNNNMNNGYHYNSNNSTTQQQQGTIPPPVCMTTHVPTKTAVYDSRHSMNMSAITNTMNANQLTMNTNPNTMMMSRDNSSNNNNNNNCYNINTQCRHCIGYMTKISELLKVNQAINDDCAQLKQVNIKYEAERDHWKSQYQQLFKQYQNLLRQNNDIKQQQQQEQQQQQHEYGDMDQDLSIKTNEDDTEEEEEEEDDEEEHEMSVSSKNGIQQQQQLQQQQQIVPLDDLAKTPKELQLQPFAQFLNDSNSITPYGACTDGINPFPFPSNSINEKTNDDINQKISQHNNNNNQNNQNKNNNNKLHINNVSIAPSVMSICSDAVGNKQYSFNDSNSSSSSSHLMTAFNSQFNSDHIQSMVQ